jgi:putative DNA primase/helicase
MKTADRARGKWRGILLALGVHQRFLTGKHGPCPFCEGRDRFRWDNDKGNGSFIWSVCGAGDGFEFLKRTKGWDFRTTAQEVDKIVGGVKDEPIRQAADPEAIKRRLRNLWAGSQPLTGDDPASAYLASRNVAHKASCLRFHAQCPKPFGEGYGQAMLALVSGTNGEAVTIHRTFIEQTDGKRLRATMPGELPEGCAVRLFPVQGNRIGIAEGIETSIAAAKRFNLPVWAALNATMLGKWTPPDGVDEVVIFGDNDAAYGGQASAYALAHRLVTRLRMKVAVRIPDQTGRDWADGDAS